MSGTGQQQEIPAIQPPRKKGPAVMLTLFLVGMAGFIATVIWVNWPKPRTAPEPLSPQLAAIIQNMPGTSDAMIYAGLKDIHQSRFWNEALPDSIRHAVPVSAGKRVDGLMGQWGINLSSDLDTLLVSFQRSGRKQQNFIGVAWGDFVTKATPRKLESAGIQTVDIGGRKAYALDSAFWVAPMGPRSMAIASSSKMLEGFFHPSGHLLERDSVTAAMLGKAIYKSHLWFTLSSPQWTAWALQSLTAKNRDASEMGNISSLQRLAMSAKFGNGINGESEWVYNDKKSAFFASSFLWAAIKLTSNPGTRTSDAARTLLNHIAVHQNQESVIITADLPMSSFRKTAPAH